MKTTIVTLGLSIVLALSTLLAHEGGSPEGIPRLDHVFLIMMENHGYQQILNNPNEPYLNSLIANKTVNFATNYFAVGHPSLTNYLEIVGGSNFGIRSDHASSWHDPTCVPNLRHRFFIVAEPSSHRHGTLSWRACPTVSITSTTALRQSMT
jgi:hypothetical protein